MAGWACGAGGRSPVLGQTGAHVLSGSGALNCVLVLATALSIRSGPACCFRCSRRAKPHSVGSAAARRPPAGPAPT